MVNMSRYEGSADKSNKLFATLHNNVLNTLTFPQENVYSEINFHTHNYL